MSKNLIITALSATILVLGIYSFTPIFKNRFSSPQNNNQEVARQYSSEDGESGFTENDNYEYDSELTGDFVADQVEPLNDFSSLIQVAATKKPTFSSTWKLPFKSGTYIQVHQGYMGNFSHRGKYALDFPTTEPTPIIAARGGKIVEISNGGKWDQWCTSWEDCNSKGGVWSGNHIIIQHSDGTRAKYLHFRPNGIDSRLRLGSILKQGDYLGQMGGTGYTCLDTACTMPDNHLHFEVSVRNSTRTIPTPFSDCNDSRNVCNKYGWVTQFNYYTVL